MDRRYDILSSPYAKQTENEQYALAEPEQAQHILVKLLSLITCRECFMPLNELLKRIANCPQDVTFDDVMTTIDETYQYTPVSFSNGLGKDMIINQAGQNEGSCKIFFFGLIHELNEAQTLACFGRFYRQDVLLNLSGKDHANIRMFMKYGWDGIEFEGEALQAR